MESMVGVSFGSIPTTRTSPTWMETAFPHPPNVNQVPFILRQSRGGFYLPDRKTVLRDFAERHVISDRDSPRYVPIELDLELINGVFMVEFYGVIPRMTVGFRFRASSDAALFQELNGSMSEFSFSFL